MIRAKKTKFALWIAAFVLLVSCLFGVLTLRNEKTASAEENISVTQVQFRTNGDQYYFFLRMQGQTDYTTGNQEQDASFITNTNVLDKVTVYFLNDSALLRDVWNGTEVATYKWGDTDTIAFRMKEGYKATDGVGARIDAGTEIPMLSGAKRTTSVSRSFWNHGTSADNAISNYTEGYETIETSLEKVHIRESEGYMHLLIGLGAGNDWDGKGEALPTQAVNSDYAGGNWLKMYLNNFTSKIKLHVKETDTWVKYGSIINEAPDRQWFMVYNGWGETGGVIRLRINNAYNGLTVDKVLFEKGCELPSYEFNGRKIAHTVHTLDAEYLCTVNGEPKEGWSVDWTFEKRLEVTFNGENSKWVTYGETVEFPADLSETKPETNEAYYVYNWFNGTEVYDFTKPVTSHLDLTSDGSFTTILKTKYTLNFVNGEEEIPSIQKVYGASLGQLPAITQKAGYDGAWVVNGEVINSETVWKWTENMTATAVYTPKTYVLSFENGEESIAPITVTFGQEVGELPAIAKKAYFNGAWTINGKAINSTYVWDIADNVTAVAQYTPVEYVVSFNGDEVKVVYGAKVEKPADPTKESTAEFNYIFDGWYVGDKKWDFETDTVEGKLNLVPKFTEETRTYKVTFTITGKDGLTLEEKELKYGEVCEFTNLFEGKDLSGYTYAVLVDGVDRASIKVTGDTAVEIVFTEFVEAEDEGGCSGYIAASAVVALLAAGVALCVKKKEN